jgi:hypothetical protein
MGVAATVALAQTPANQQTPPAPQGEIPFLQKWQSSGHADLKGMPFNDWNDTNPPAVPVDCAKCHSTPGFLDYMGMDGTAFRKVDKPAPIGTTIQCIACHNDQARFLTSVKFPSGIELGLLESANRCAECHQGRASKVQVDAAIKQANLANLDTPSPGLRFINIHYFAAAATLYGAQAKGGYEYDGFAYQPRNRHVEGYQTCVNCHDVHSLEIRVGECAGCHAGVKTVEDLKNVRMNGSLADYDGDGNIKEGIFFEIQGLQEMLVNSMKAYAVKVSNKPIAYNAAAYPYFFVDLNGNGQVDPNEAVSANAYNAFTPRLLKASYNYQTSIKDPGAFAHNPKYIIQLLHDSIGDLDQAIGLTPRLTDAQRDDPGHFAATHEAWRHWDAEGEVPKECVRCHTDVGLPMYLKNGTTIAVEPAESMKCITCHQNMQNFALIPAGQATFPSGAVLSLDNGQSNLCIQCHQGRESKVSIDNAIQRAGVGPNEVSSALNFINPHYFGAGATLFGTQAKGMYEFTGKQYNGRFMHVPNYNNCNQCHDVHALNVKANQCSACHTNVKSDKDLFNIRITPIDFDGDGDVTEGLSGEIETERMKLQAAMQSYAANTVGTQIAYNPLAYPYFFVDANGNGQADPDEKTAFRSWTPTLLRTAFNLQWSVKDPGNFAHNGQYVLQVLYDTLQDIGGNDAVAGMTRPAVRAQ